MSDYDARMADPVANPLAETLSMTHDALGREASVEHAEAGVAVQTHAFGESWRPTAPGKEPMFGACGAQTSPFFVLCGGSNGIQCNQMVEDGPRREVKWEVSDTGFGRLRMVFRSEPTGKEDRMSPRSMILNAAVLILVSACAIPAQVSAAAFFDGDFDAGWIDTVLLVDDPFVAGTGPGVSSGAITRRTSGGNPGPYRESVHDVTFGDVIYTVGLNTSAVYDPGTSGAIASLDLSIDLLEDPTVGGSSGVWLVVHQDDIAYFSPYGEFSRGSWQKIDVLGNAASDFVIDPNATLSFDKSGPHPDFTAGGTPITFGYALGNRVTGGHFVLTHRADNWAVTVNQVPEPVALALLAAGIGLFLVGRPRRIAVG